MSKSFKVAVVGATGVVGAQLLQLMAQRRFPVEELFVFASAESIGQVLEFGEDTAELGRLEVFDFATVDLVFFAADAQVARQYVPKAAAAGCTVIDCSAAFRNQLDVPLMLPEINGPRLAGTGSAGVYASPGAAAVILSLVLDPLQRAVSVARVNAMVSLPASSWGRRGVNALARQSAQALNGGGLERPAKGRQPIAFNVFSAAPTAGGQSGEEATLTSETRRILDDAQLPINVTIANVPVFYGLSMALHIETHSELTVSQALALLADAPALVVTGADGAQASTDRGDRRDHAVRISRVRRDPTHCNGLNLWAVGDNVSRGAALNCVAIAEVLLKCGQLVAGR